MKTNSKGKFFAFLIAAILIIAPHSSSAFDVLSPSFLTASAKNGAVFLQWTNYSAVTNHIVEYKQTTSSTWVTFPHPVLVAPGIVVNNLVNNTSYDFRVSAIVSPDQSAPSAPVSAIPSATALHVSNNQIIATGQSNAQGSYAFPVLTTTQPYNNKMLNANGTALIPLAEPITGGMSWTGETMSSSFANNVTRLTQPTIPNYVSIISLNAIAGVPYTSLKQGTDIYNHALSDVRAAKLQSNVLGNKTLIVPAVTTLHGETDEGNGTTADQYEDYLLEWQNDYQNDIRAITGQEEPVRLFTYQMNSWIWFGSAVPHTALGQYAAAKNNPDKIVMVTSEYIFDPADGVHLTNYSQRRLGEYFAKIYKKVVIDGEDWSPLMPTSVSMTGNVITATFHVPVPPLAFDTTAVLAQANYGFEYADSSNSASITNVAITGPDTVQVTLSNVPTGSNPRLRYAYTGTPWSNVGSHIAGTPRGNLRDSDTTEATVDAAVPAYMGGYLRNWSLTFDEAVTVVAQTTPDQPTSVSAVAGTVNGTAIISFTAPAYNGGSPITGYIVTSAPGNITVTGTGSPITITGLSNHTTYTFTVRAINANGQSTPSANSNAITLNWPTLVTVNPRPITPSSTNKKPGVQTISGKNLVESTISNTGTINTASVISSQKTKKEPTVAVKATEAKTVESKSSIE